MLHVFFKRMSHISISEIIMLLTSVLVFFQNSRSSMTSGQVLSLPPTSETVPLLRVYQLMTRFINVSKFLQAMLM
jgi:hypothetical protein